MRILIIFILLLFSLTSESQSTLIKDFGNFKITSDKKNFYLSPSENDTLFLMTGKKDLPIKNEIILLKRDGSSDPYEFSTYYQYSYLKYYKLIANDKPETEATNPEFTAKNRAYLLANCDYIKRTKNWLIVNIPERVEMQYYGLHTPQGSDSLDETGGQVYQTEYIHHGGIFIYDLKNKKAIIDLNSKTMLNINKNGIFLRKMNSKRDVEDIYSMMDWKGNLIFDNITFKQLLKDDTKLKLIAGDGNIKSIYEKKTSYLLMDTNFIDNNTSGFHYVNNQNKCGYFSFAGYHLEDSYDFLYFHENKFYIGKNNVLQIRQLINSKLDTLAAEAKEDIQMFVEPNSGYVKYFIDDKAKRSFDRNISFMKSNDEYIISIPQDIEELADPVLIMEDPNDPSTWYPDYDENGNPKIQSYQYFTKSIGNTLILDKKTGISFEMDSVAVKNFNEDGWLFNQHEYKILDKGHEEINHYFAMNKNRTRKSSFYSDSVLLNHPEQIIQFILNDNFYYVGKTYDYYNLLGAFYYYKNSFRMFGNDNDFFNSNNKSFQLSNFKYEFQKKLKITDTQNYGPDSAGIAIPKTYNIQIGEKNSYQSLENNLVKRNFLLYNDGYMWYRDDALYFFRDSLAIINRKTYLDFANLMVKPDPTDRDTWYDSLDINAIPVKDYKYYYKNDNPLILYNYKSNKLVKILYGCNVRFKGPDGMILEQIEPAKNANEMHHTDHYFSVLNYKGEIIIPAKIESEIDPLQFLKAIGIKDIDEKSFQRLNNLDEKENLSIVCSYKKTNGLKSLWLEDYIDQPVIDCKNIILPVKENAMIIFENNDGFNIFHKMNDSIMKFKNNYFDLAVRHDHSVVGTEMGTNKDENLWNSISNSMISGKMFYKQENLLYYNLPVNLPAFIERFFEFYHSPEYNKYGIQEIRDNTHASGIYDLATDKWLIEPKYDYLTKFKEYFVARYYDLDNTEISLYDIASTPMYTFFDLKGIEIFKGDANQVKEKFGFDISEVQILPQD